MFIINSSKEIDKEKLGNTIKKLRLSMGLNQEDFGKLFLDDSKNEGLANRSVVSAWERGVSIPSPHRLKIIADNLNLDVEELLYGSLRNKITLTIFDGVKEGLFPLNKETFERVLNNAEMYSDYLLTTDRIISYYLLELEADLFKENAPIVKKAIDNYISKNNFPINSDALEKTTKFFTTIYIFDDEFNLPVKTPLYNALTDEYIIKIYKHYCGEQIKLTNEETELLEHYSLRYKKKSKEHLKNVEKSELSVHDRILFLKIKELISKGINKETDSEISKLIKDFKS